MAQTIESMGARLDALAARPEATIAAFPEPADRSTPL
jgi:hypothetical protein